MKRTTSRLVTTALLLICCCGWSSNSFAQSLDANSPAPLTSPDLTGRIIPLDVGDPRSTRHYYIFRAGPGDLILNLESNNLNGDVDLFTAVNLQPLLKISMYAASSADATTKTSKSVFLRRPESILLRVEARTAGDAEGQYHLNFVGPFEATAASAPRPNEDNSSHKPSTASARSATRRVNSVGARIEEPPTEIPAPLSTPPKRAAAQTKTSIKPAPSVANETPATETTAPAPASSTTARPARRTRPLPRARSSTARRRIPAPAQQSAPPESIARSSSGDTTAGPAQVAEPPAAPVAAPPAQNVLPILGARLIIEMRDGEKLERPMSEVRRVTVERGILIVLTNKGSLERRPMSQILKVSIEP